MPVGGGLTVVMLTAGEWRGLQRCLAPAPPDFSLEWDPQVPYCRSELFRRCPSPVAGVQLFRCARCGTPYGGDQVAFELPLQVPSYALGDLDELEDRGDIARVMFRERQPLYLHDELLIRGRPAQVIARSVDITMGRRYYEVSWLQDGIDQRLGRTS